MFDLMNLSKTATDFAKTAVDVAQNVKENVLEGTERIKPSTPPKKVVISAPVGKGGVNRPDDVKIIQQALNTVPMNAGRPNPLLKVDGIIGPLTIGAISDYQRINLGFSDGRVDPGNKTIAKLNEHTGGTVIVSTPPVITPSPLPYDGRDKIIWNYLKKQITEEKTVLNDFAVAGIMGNLAQESRLIPNMLEMKYQLEYDYSSKEYTKLVDKEIYKIRHHKDNKERTFINDDFGYGLAQWTHTSRKTKLYNYWKKVKKEKANASIGDMDVQLGFLWEEILNWKISTTKTLTQKLNEAKTVQEAINDFLRHFEMCGPFKGEEKQQHDRGIKGQDIYDRMSI